MFEVGKAAPGVASVPASVFDLTMLSISEPVPASFFLAFIFFYVCVDRYHLAKTLQLQRGEELLVTLSLTHTLCFWNKVSEFSFPSFLLLFTSYLMKTVLVFGPQQIREAIFEHVSMALLHDSYKCPKFSFLHTSS